MKEDVRDIVYISGGRERERERDRQTDRQTDRGMYTRQKYVRVYVI